MPFGGMLDRFDFCLPTKSTTVPLRLASRNKTRTANRIRVERDGDHVRLITRGGYNWTKRFPWIVEAARKNRHRQFVIDGEAVVLGVDGISDSTRYRRTLPRQSAWGG